MSCRALRAVLSSSVAALLVTAAAAQGQSRSRQEHPAQLQPVAELRSASRNPAPSATTPAPATSQSMPATVPPSTTSPTLSLPAGSRRDLYFDSNRTGRYEIYAMRPDGSDVRQLSHGSSDAWWPRVSRDGRQLLFYRTPAGVHDLDYTKTELWKMDADGSKETLLRRAGADGWALQGHVDWSPDGTQLVMFGGTRGNPQLYLTDPLGRHPVALTNRPGVSLDPSFSPDGRSVAFIGCPQATCYPSNYEVYLLQLADGTTERLTYDALPDHDPVVSPDGTRLAWITEMTPAGAGRSLPIWDVRIGVHDGTAIRRLFNDSNITSRPAWESDAALLVHRLEIGVDEAFQVYRITTDGSSRQRLTQGPYVNEYPV